MSQIMLDLRMLDLSDSNALPYCQNYGAVCSEQKCFLFLLFPFKKNSFPIQREQPLGENDVEIENWHIEEEALYTVSDSPLVIPYF